MADREKWWLFRLPEWTQCMARGRHQLVHVENIYGDEILMLGCRSIWKCSHCGFHFHKSRLAAISGPMPQPEACIHDPDEPEGCYRVRCQLGKQCAAARHDAGVIETSDEAQQARNNTPKDQP